VPTFRCPQAPFWVQKPFAALSAGSHSISAVYSGDADFSPSISPTLTQTVNRAATTVTLTASANPSIYSSSVTFTATVTTGATGTVAFYDGSSTLGAGTIGNGTATYTTSVLSTGSHPISAVYSGDANFLGASSSLTLIVTPGPPTFSGISPVSGLPGTTVTISGANFGAIQGTSTVTFNGTAATPVSWSDATIVVAVPAGATTGNVVLTICSQIFDGPPFTVLSPTITGLSPPSGPAQMGLVIVGQNFGAPASGTVTIGSTPNGTLMNTVSWSAPDWFSCPQNQSCITVQMPAGFPAGWTKIWVTVGGVASNGMDFEVTAFGCTPPGS